MPSDLIRSIFSRRLRYRDDKETVTSQAASNVSEKATSSASALHDPPPPYAFENLAMNNDKELPSTLSSIQPATAQASTRSGSKLSSRDSIRFCPHATSSFERVQRILRLPNFRDSFEGLDALTPGPDHRSPFTSGFRLCKPDSGSDLSISEFFPSEPSPPEVYSFLDWESRYRGKRLSRPESRLNSDSRGEILTVIFRGLGQVPVRQVWHSRLAEGQSRVRDR